MNVRSSTERRKALLYAALLSVLFAFAMPIAFGVRALAQGSVNPQDVLPGGTPDQVVKEINNVTNTIFTIVVGIGVVFTVYAVTQIIMSFARQDPESKQRASMMLAIGALLIVSPSVMQSLSEFKTVSGAFYHVTIVIANVAMVAGIVVTSIAVVDLVRQFQDQNPEARSRAAIFFVVGLALISVRFIAQMLLKWAIQNGAL